MSPRKSKRGEKREILTFYNKELSIQTMPRGAKPSVVADTCHLAISALGCWQRTADSSEDGLSSTADSSEDGLGSVAGPCLRRSHCYNEKLKRKGFQIKNIDGPSAHERCLKLLIGRQIQVTSQFPSLPIRLSGIQKLCATVSAHWWGRNSYVTEMGSEPTHTGSTSQRHKTTIVYPPTTPGTRPLSIYERHMHKVLIMTLFILAKDWEWPTYLCTEDCSNKLVHGAYDSFLWMLWQSPQDPRWGNRVQGSEEYP